jgi:ssDNA-binding Zn-finger/Zn-ribbon topoisomerase 1
MELSNPVKYTIIGVGLGLSAIIMAWQFWPSGGVGGGGNADMVMLCTNPKCDKAYKLKPAEFQKMIEKQGGMDPMMMMGGMGAMYECKFCKQKTASIAYECPKCKNIFIMPNPMMGGGMTNDYPDRCPECKFSQTEEDMKTQK